MQDTSASHFFILPSELSKKLDEFLGGGEREGIITEMNLPPLVGKGEGMQSSRSLHAIETGETFSINVLLLQNDSNRNVNKRAALLP